MNVGDQIRRSVSCFRENVAMISGLESRTFQEIDDRTNRLANALRKLGIVKGDRVATLLENSIRCCEADFALAKSGLVRVSLNPRSTRKDIQFIVDDSDARVVLYGSTFDGVISEAKSQLAKVEHWIRIDELDDARLATAPRSLDYETWLDGAPGASVLEEVDPEDLYCLFYTSGTTGLPKGVMLSHRAILQISYNLLIGCGPLKSGEKVLLMQPMSHGAGFYVLPWFLRGGCSVIMRQFDPGEVIDLVTRHEIETIKLIPTMLQRIVRLENTFPLKATSLRQIIYGASPMPTEVLRDAIAKLGLKFIQVYGQSEAAATICIMPIEDHDPDSPFPERIASVGRPWPTVEMKIVDDHGRELPPHEIGEVILRAPHMMSGYWKRPDLTAETVRGGWLYTRDLGRMDDRGYIYLLGRRDEMIISGGYNISPREIEEAIYAHPAVQEAAVVGEPDPEWGQAVVAYVSFRQGETTERDLIEFVKDSLGFKRPKRVYRVSELPKNSNGKIQKLELNPKLAISREPTAP